MPRWRAALLATYDIDERWSGSVGMRYSGRQFGQLDNSTQRLRLHRLQPVLRRRPARAVPHLALVGVSAGIDNLNNYHYWAFHPYPQRTYHAELRFDL